MFFAFTKLLKSLNGRCFSIKEGKLGFSPVIQIVTTESEHC